MWRTSLLVLITTLSAALANAQIEPEDWQPVETMPDPGNNWFIAFENGAGRIFDTTTGQMMGMVSTSNLTPTIQPNIARKEFYSTNIFYSRGTYGERTDRFIIHDFENLSPIAEIEIPQKSMINSYRHYIGLLSGGAHVVSFNMTPAQSVTVVDVEKREFVGEISTAGCALVLPIPQDNAFLSICSDGSVMLIGLDEDGNEAYRKTSDEFFDVFEDPVYDVPERTADGWLFITFEGTAYEVKVKDGEIEVSDPWILVEDEEREGENAWWPGGGQFYTVQQDLGRLYVIMHEDGEEGEPYESGEYVWVYDIKTRTRIAEHELEFEIESLIATQEKEPVLIASTDDDEADEIADSLALILDPMTLEVKGQIPEVEGATWVDF